MKKYFLISFLILIFLLSFFLILKIDNNKESYFKKGFTINQSSHPHEIWFYQSVKDLESAEKLHNLGYYNTASFLCEQSVEKALKSYYIFKFDKTPPKIHDLVLLSNQLNISEIFNPFIGNLTLETIDTRYPNINNSIPYLSYNYSLSDYYIINSKQLLNFVYEKIN